MMPYGVHEFNGQSINFDWIYPTIFKRAIQNVKEKGKRLIARRADEYAQSRIWMHKVIQNLLNSRLALADLTTHNPNVLYELALRHAILPSGTVLISLPGVAIPSDLSSILVTKYEYIPPEEIKASIRRVSKVLRETLRVNEIDNPAYAAAQEFARRMGTAEQPTPFGIAVVEAEEAVLHGDLDRVGDFYAKAARLEPEIALVHQRRGNLLMESGRVDEAQNALQMAFVLNLPEATRVRFKHQLAVRATLTTTELASNAGVEGSIVVQRVRDLKTNKGYDTGSDTYSDMLEKGIIDPTKVTRSVLQNTASIANLLMTTEALATELPEKEAPAMPDDGGMGHIH